MMLRIFLSGNPVFAWMSANFMPSFDPLIILRTTSVSADFSPFFLLRGSGALLRAAIAASKRSSLALSFSISRLVGMSYLLMKNLTIASKPMDFPFLFTILLLGMGCCYVKVNSCRKLALDQ